MIRYHNDPTGYILVSARRKPRGYIMRVKEIQYVGWATRYEAFGTTETVEGWRPLGFNGYMGPVYHTKRAAADRLLSDHRFREDVW